MRMDTAAEARVALVADLTDPGSVERLPERRHCEIAGVPVAWMALAPFEASAVAKLRLALAAALDPARLTS